jgi:CDP-diacylglycerol--glycerol-3-phosphate 3-phosphatidyltransferase
MNIPNTLTLLRIFFVPLLVGALVGEGRREMLALAIFLVAAATDLLDGYLARRWGQITTVGMLLDPIADKLLISAALISLVQVHAVAGWMAILIIGREFAISGLRSIAAAEGYTIRANELGKTKMFFQVVAISMVLVAMRQPQWQFPAEMAMIVVVLTSFASAVSYFVKFWGKLDEQIKTRRRRELLEVARAERKLRIAALRQASQTRSSGSRSPVA